MAIDIIPIHLGLKQASRTAQDFSRLTEVTFPYFLAVKWAETQAGNSNPVYLHMYSPKVSEKAPAISARIYRRVTGKGSVDKLKPSFRSTILSESGTEAIDLWAQYYTVIYEFKIFHNEFFALGDLTSSFEDFMYYVQPELEKRGVESIYFEEQIGEQLLNEHERADDVFSVVLRYTVILQKLHKLPQPVIKTINFQAAPLGDVISQQVSVTRDSVLRYDPIPEALYEKKFLHVNLVSAVPFDTLQGLLAQAKATGGVLGLETVTAQNVFFPSEDYIIEDISYPSGITAPSILWIKSPSAKVPNPGDTYYILYDQPFSVKTEALRTGT